MLNVGKVNKLKVVRTVDFGLFLDSDVGEILLPIRYVPPGAAVGDLLDVFIYFDSEDRIIATTEKPLAMLGEFANLKVVSTSEMGAFLNWGLLKDLFLPFGEQTRRFRTGDEVIIHVYFDESSRLAASMKVEKFLEKGKGDYREGQEVNLMVLSKTDLGYKAIIEGKHLGLLYDNAIFQTLKIGQQIRGYISKIRDDEKIDLVLQKPGYEILDNIAEKILALLKEKGGFVDINDRTPPETIYNLFGVSKRKFKFAIGGLYSKRLIAIEPEGIRLVKPK